MWLEFNFISFACLSIDFAVTFSLHVIVNIQGSSLWNSCNDISIAQVCVLSHLCRAGDGTRRSTAPPSLCTMGVWNVYTYCSCREADPGVIWLARSNNLMIWAIPSSCLCMLMRGSEGGASSPDKRLSTYFQQARERSRELEQENQQLQQQLSRRVAAHRKLRQTHRELQATLTMERQQLQEQVSQMLYSVHSLKC